MNHICPECGVGARLDPSRGLCSPCSDWEAGLRLATPDSDVFALFVIAIVDRARKDTVVNGEIPVWCSCGLPTAICAANFLSSSEEFVASHPDDPTLLIEAIGKMLEDAGRDLTDDHPERPNARRVHTQGPGLVAAAAGRLVQWPGDRERARRRQRGAPALAGVAG